MELILHNIRSLHNVGSIFRTADGAGVTKIYLTGITPSPLDVFGHYRQPLAKVSLGAERTMPWEKLGSGADSRTCLNLIKKLKKQGIPVCAIEQDSKSIPYNSAKILRKASSGNIVFILGAEVRGLPPSILKACDHILEIPMSGQKESLNVSVAAGVVIFALRDQ